ncbi:MAG: hypothetical protein M1817_006306 [Caeruleum heppii]|nr:MAG: hypothetical protein M1817_006306 [Caeruleum heppii]
MRRSSLISALAFAAIHACTAAPVQELSPPVNVERRASVDCRNTSTGIDPSCWKTLGMAEWLRNWQATESTKCQQDEGFSGCFLRMNKLSGTDCTVINQQSCGSDITNDLDPAQPEVFYALYAIYAINNFFNSWWLATQFAASQTALQVDAMVQVLDSPKKENLGLQSILTALLLGLAMVPGPVGIALEAASTVTKIAANVLTTGLMGAPLVAKQLFPAAGTAETQLIQMANLKALLGNVAQGLSDRLAPALKTAEQDIESFIQLGNTGIFSSKPAPALNQQTKGLERVLNTYILSSGLVANQWDAVVALDTNPQQLGRNGSRIAYRLDCEQYDANGVCNAWAYDAEYNMAFTLNHRSAMKDNPNKILTTAFNNGWTTRELLFNGAAACKRAGNLGKGMVVNVDNGLNIDCVSQLDVCTWDMSCTQRNSNKCEFTDCKTQDGVGAARAGWRSGEYQVPAGYLGPLINKQGLQWY